jgi:hypothetical protein
MSELVIITLFSGIGVCIVGGVAYAFNMNGRVARIETFIELMGRKSARALHSPHTPQLDAILEKIEKDVKITPGEMEVLKKSLDEILHGEAPEKFSRDYRASAAVLYGFLSKNMIK